MRLRQLVFAALVASAAALAGCGTYSTRRAALVPPASPELRSGVPMDRDAELSLGTPALARLDEPEADTSAGLEVPRYQVTAAGRLRVLDGLDVGVVWDEGSSRRADALAEDQPRVDHGNVRGGGLTAMASWRLPAEAALSLSLGALFYAVPYVEYRTCTDGCGGVPYTTVSRDRAVVPVLSLGVSAAKRFGRVAVFVGGTLRNQPTIERTVDVDDEVTVGTFSASAHAGLEVQVAGGVRILSMAFVTRGNDTLDLPLTIALALTWGFDVGGGAAAAPPYAPR